MRGGFGTAEGWRQVRFRSRLVSPPISVINPRMTSSGDRRSCLCHWYASSMCMRRPCSSARSLASGCSARVRRKSSRTMERRSLGRSEERSGRLDKRMERQSCPVRFSSESSQSIISPVPKPFAQPTSSIRCSSSSCRSACSRVHPLRWRHSIQRSMLLSRLTTSQEPGLGQAVSHAACAVGRERGLASASIKSSSASASNSATSPASWIGLMGSGCRNAPTSVSRSMISTPGIPRSFPLT